MEPFFEFMVSYGSVFCPSYSECDRRIAIQEGILPTLRTGVSKNQGSMYSGPKTPHKHEDAVATETKRKKLMVANCTLPFPCGLWAP